MGLFDFNKDAGDTEVMDRKGLSDEQLEELQTSNTVIRKILGAKLPIEGLKADFDNGTVVLKGLVTKQGTVADIKVLREAHEKLAAAATAAVAQWQFTPTRLNCVPVEVEMTVTVNFTTGR